MATRPHDRDAGTVGAHGRPLIEPMPFALLDDPLDYIFADHFRQRSVCVVLKRFAAERHVRREEADGIIAFFQRDLPLHHADEDHDLFPALRRRALPEDDLAAPLARLSDDHRISRPMVEGIVDALAADPAEDTVRLKRGTSEMMLAYAASEHKHLAIENGIVLAIARVRLTRADLAQISRSMKARRGA
jgi:hemerythrin-like domain-containing protein